MKVLRAFKTPIHKFAVGMMVTPADVDGPMAFEDWVAGGFVEADEPVAVAAEADPAEAAADPAEASVAAEPEAPHTTE